MKESDATRLVSRTNSAGIYSWKKVQPDGKWSVVVDRENVDRALDFLTQARLLPTSEKNPHQSSSLLLSRNEEHYRYERSLSGGIEETLESIKGILEAKVHLNLPSRDSFFQVSHETEQATGSVLLVASPLFQLKPGEISRLVSGAAGIKEDSVSVLITFEGVEEKKPSAPQEEAAVNKEILSIPRNVVTSTPFGSGLQQSWIKLVLLMVPTVVGGAFLIWAMRRPRFLRKHASILVGH